MSESKITIRRGIGRTLFMWLMVMALVPMATISRNGYWQAHDSLKKDALTLLSATLNFKANYIEDFFAEKIRHVNSLARARVNMEFLKKLRGALQKSGGLLEPFVKSFEWSLMVDHYGEDLTAFKKLYEYENLYLMDSMGNILFSAENDGLLGKNILSKAYASTLFGKAVRESLNSGKIVLSDREKFKFLDNKVTSFLIHVMVDEEGNRIGLMVLRIPFDTIDEVLRDQVGAGESLDYYLLGRDLKMRSNSILMDRPTMLEQRVDTKVTRQWLAEEDAEDSVEKQSVLVDANLLDKNHQFHLLQEHYLDYRGVDVLGGFAHLTSLDDLGVEWSLIAEIDAEEAFSASTALRNHMLIALMITALLVFFVAGFVARYIGKPLIQLTNWAGRVEAGDLAEVSIQTPNNELGALVSAFSRMTRYLRESAERDERDQWLQNANSELNDRMRGDRFIVDLGRDVLSFFAERLDASVGAFYVTKEDDSLARMAGYADGERKSINNTFAPGEGIIGQVALEKKPLQISQIPEDYIRIHSGVGESAPCKLLVFPFVWNDRVEAVVELGTFNTFSELHLALLKQESEGIAMAISAAQSRVRLQETLEKTKQQALAIEQQSKNLTQSNELLLKRDMEVSQSNSRLEEQATALKASHAKLGQNQIKLQEQQEELRVSNEELEAHSLSLQASEEELRVSNEELEAQAQQLEEQKEIADRNNEELKKIQLELQQKIQEVETASQYKSEFLANMSHELRTPLNSLLILSQSLADNEAGNLTEGDVQDAFIIHNSATDLLNLINEILDLAKIEAGRMEIRPERLVLKSFSESLERQFRPVADKRGVNFSQKIAESSPNTVWTDPEKAGRIIKNLLSNAFKFTREGDVSVHFQSLPPEWHPKNSDFSSKGGVMIQVRDTGIGIPEKKHRLIFEAFQQADGSTSRQFGGTGLGLSISTQLARLLGAKILLESTEGKGSVFSLLLPQRTKDEFLQDELSQDELSQDELSQDESSQDKLHPVELVESQPRIETPIVVNASDDDRNTIEKGDRVMLVIEDDPYFARIVQTIANQQGFKSVWASDGESGLALALEYKPVGVVLDIGLPGMDGWGVLERLKADAETRHIPVHIMSAMDDSNEGLQKGAVGFCDKPVTRSHIEEAFAKMVHFSGSDPRSLLLVEDNADSRRATVKLLEAKDIEMSEAASGFEALEQMRIKTFDCMILDLGLPDMSGFDLLDTISADATLTGPPVIVYSGRELTRMEYDRLKAYTNSFVVKGVKSAERLLNEVTLFLHRTERDLPEAQRLMIRKLNQQENVFYNKTVLIVDDDVSNLYALAKQLERKELKTVMASDGLKALAALDKNPKVDCILMDIMMPNMDGYQAMLDIRKQTRFEKLPIIALTAKAMSDDKKKCLDAGASDYLTKPVDMVKLFSMMRVWMHS